MTPNNYQYKFDEFSLLTNEKLLLHGDKVVSLSGRAFDALVLLVQNEGKVVHKQDLINKIWTDTFVEEGSLAVAINSLRKALQTDNNKKFIETFPKRGYRFNGEVEKILVSENELKQPVSLPVRGVPKRTETPVAALPLSTSRNTFQIIQSQILQRKWLLLTITMMVLSFSFTMIAFPDKPKVAAQEQVAIDNNKLKIAILPFVDLRPTLGSRDLCFRFADSMRYALSQSQDFSIVSTIPIDKYFQKIPQPEEIKKEVDVDFVLIGTFIKDGEIVEVDSQLIEVKSGKVVMTNKEILNNITISSLSEQFTKKLASKIKLFSNLLSAMLKNKK